MAKRWHLPLDARWLAGAAALLTVIAVTLIASTAARFTWLVVASGGQHPQVAEPMSLEEEPEGPSTAPRISDVAEHRIFGKPPGDEGSASAQEPDTLPETDRDLELRGVMAAPPEQGTGMAIIESQAGRRLYQVGIEVTEGLEVVEIHAARVVLRDGADLEVLEIEHPEWEGATAVTAADPSEQPHQFRHAENGDTAGERPGGEAESGGALGRYEIETLRRQYERDPRSLMDIFAVAPVVDDGTIEGVRLSARDEEGAEILESSGLQEGDVIQRVENVPVRDQRRLEALGEQIDRVSELELQVERDGEEQEITVDLY